MPEKSSSSIRKTEKNLGAWRLETGLGGLPKLVFERGNVYAELYLNGAHVTAFENRAKGLSMFWMDSSASLVSGRAIKGGVPLVFPWFGPLKDRGDFPRHGFARNAAWSVAGGFQDGKAHGVSLELVDSDLTRVVWPHAFKARLEVAVEDLAVSMRLVVVNTDKTAFTFENALHAYFAIGDVRAIAVEGLDGATYVDKIDGMKRKKQSGDVRLPKETDSVFVGATNACRIKESGRATLRISKSGSQETVVWNPGAKKGDPSAVAPAFVCVEPANCMDHSITLGPGEEHVLDARFEFEV